MNLFSIEGRIGRFGYFLWFLALIVIASVVMVIFSMDADSAAYIFVGIPLAILSVFPVVQRLHDLNKSGWLFLLSFIPLVNFGFGLYLLFGQGSNGENQYGAPPPNLLNKMTIKSPEHRSPVDTQVNGSSFQQDRDKVPCQRAGDEAFYLKASDELEGEQMDKALWAKLFAQANGNENKAKARYIQLRSKELKDDAAKELRSAEERMLALRKQEEARAQIQLQEKQKKERIIELTRSLEDLLKKKRYADARSVANTLVSFDPGNTFVKEQLKVLLDLAQVEQTHKDIRKMISALKSTGVRFFLIKSWDTEIARLLSSMSDKFGVIGDDADEYKKEVQELRISGARKIKQRQRGIAIALPVIAVAVVALCVGHSVFKKREIERLTAEFHQAIVSRDYPEARKLYIMLTKSDVPYNAKEELGALKDYRDKKWKINRDIGSDRMSFEKYGGDNWKTALEKIDKAAQEDVPVFEACLLAQQAYSFVHDLREKIDALRVVEWEVCKKFDKYTDLLKKHQPKLFSTMRGKIDQIHTLTDIWLTEVSWKKISYNIDEAMKLVEFPLSVTTTPADAAVTVTISQKNSGAILEGDGSFWKLEKGQTYIIDVSKRGYKTHTETIVPDWSGMEKKHITLERSCLKEGESWIVDLGEGVEMEFVPIPAGSFMMGSNGEKNEKPVHKVTLSKPFWMAKTEVTQRQYKQIMGSNPSSFQGLENPVEKVSWNDVVEFCKKLTEIDRQAGCLPVSFEYTLPTEAQWEYACRAGTSGDFAGSIAMAWSASNSGGNTHSVGTKQANAWGLFDMHGNVWEWCNDWYGSYKVGSVVDPKGASSGACRVFRGGGWNRSFSNCRSANRNRNSPYYTNYYLGFRPLVSAVVTE